MSSASPSDINLSQLESALVSRHYSTAELLDPFVGLLADEIQILEAEISSDEQLLGFKKQRLARLREVIAPSAIRLQQSSDELHNLVKHIAGKARNGSHAEIDPKKFGFRTTPNGTVTAIFEDSVTQQTGTN